MKNTYCVGSFVLVAAAGLCPTAADAGELRWESAGKGFLALEKEKAIVAVVDGVVADSFPLSERAFQTLAEEWPANLGEDLRGWVTVRYAGSEDGVPTLSFEISQPVERSARREVVFSAQMEVHPAGGTELAQDPDFIGRWMTAPDAPVEAPGNQDCTSGSCSCSNGNCEADACCTNEGETPRCRCVGQNCSGTCIKTNAQVVLEPNL